MGECKNNSTLLTLTLVIKVVVRDDVDREKSKRRNEKK
jgi:hypothetical protein